MSILKGTHSGIYAKLTPEYIVTFGYVSYVQDPNLFFKNKNQVFEHHIYWEDKRKKFVFMFDRDIDGIKTKYEYVFDTYPELKILEQYWYSESEEERKNAYAKIVEKSKLPDFDMFRIATNIFTKTIAEDLVSVQPMEAPKAQLFWHDIV